MALRIFHPCAFNFKTTNIRRVGNVVSGGKSLSGYESKVETDGGGYFQADFTNGSTRDKAQGNAWRAITDSDGDDAYVVMLCAERLYQPVGALQKVTHSDATPFSDGTVYDSSGADFTTTADAPLRATSLAITGASELALIGGELFSINHPTWGWRAYRVRSVDDETITFRPPLREATPADTPLEFDTPRCQMILGQATDNQTDIGRFTSCSIIFVEDMRKPSA